MSTSDGTPGGTQQRVLVEMRVSSGQGAAFAMQTAAGMNAPGFQLDTAYDPVPVSSPASHAAQLAAANEETVIVRGTIDESQIPQLEAQPNVLKVWRDAPIAPFTQTSGAPTPVVVSPIPAAGVCPIPPCDCDPATAKGTIADVAAYLGTNQIWNAGNRADVIVVGDVDGGITALGRTPKPGETAQIPKRDWRLSYGRLGHDGGGVGESWQHDLDRCAGHGAKRTPLRHSYLRWRLPNRRCLGCAGRVPVGDYPAPDGRNASRTHQ